MRHRKKSEKFSRSRAQRKALIKSLLQAVIINERIITISSRAKYLRGKVDKLITWAKKDSLFCRRLAFRVIGNHNLVKRLFDVVGPRFKHINGGYTRVLNLGCRKGDGASLSLLELTVQSEKEKVSSKEKKKKTKIEDSGKEEKKTAFKKEKEPKEGIISGVKKILKKKKNIF